MWNDTLLVGHVRTKDGSGWHRRFSCVDACVEFFGHTCTVTHLMFHGYMMGPSHTCSGRAEEATCLREVKPGVHAVSSRYGFLYTAATFDIRTCPGNVH